jgi:Electron transfer DM13
MDTIGALGRAFFGALYDYRLAAVVVASLAGAITIGLATRRGWFAAGRRHPARTGAVLALMLAVGLPLTWYLASPLFLRTSLVEAEDAAAPSLAPRPPSVAPSSPAVADPSSTATDPPTDVSTAAPSAPTPAPTPFAPATLATGTFHGSDDFHFGTGTARIIETRPGQYRLRFDEFSVRNGPDLYVYLSPSADGYADGALELGKLKATDGSFGYDIPDGVDPSRYASTVVWCKQFSHLFATAPFRDAG